uniref:Uncharacterized protein n=1 Tax=Psorophora albipes TaxID=869069 RepID=T1DFN7_9DIPT
MTALVAVVAARVIGREAAVTRNVAASVTAVAPVQILLAVTCKVAHLVAFVALFATATATAEFATWSAGPAATTTTANVLAVAGIMSRPVALEARISRHFFCCLFC